MLSASVAFAATDDDAAVGEVTDEIDENVLTVSEDNDVVQENSSSGVDVAPVANDVVTNSTFYNYFDDIGVIRSNVTSEELVFEGDFTGVGVDYIMINKSIKFTGKDAVFNNVTFVISSDNVTIDGFKLIQNNSDIALITFSDVSNVVISNNVLEYTAMSGVDSYAIYASNVDALKLLNNTFTYVGNTAGTNVNNVIRVEGDGKKSTNVLVDGNVFDISIPSTDVKYDDYYNSISCTDGLVFYACENLTVSNNNITLNYNNAIGSYDTIHVITVGNSNFDYDELDYLSVCNNAIVANNRIDAKGHSFIYGIMVCADNFAVDHNYLNVSSDSHYAAGICVDGPSNVGVVSDNGIFVQAPNLAFGVYSYPYMGSVEDVTFNLNGIFAKAYAACGMEIVQDNPTIDTNFIILNGNHTTGIVANMNYNGTVKNNVIYSSGSNIGKNATGDSMVHPESTGISIKGDTLIFNNTIHSTSIGVNLILGGKFNLINNTVDVDACGDTDNYGVYANGIDGLVASGNKIDFVGFTDGNIFSNGLFVDGVNNVTILDNIFKVDLISAPVTWVEEGGGYVSYPVSEGIVIKNSNGAIFKRNNVATIYHNVTGGEYNTIYVVDLAKSPNSEISDNLIGGRGYSYIYGVIVTSENFTIFNNTIIVVADDYCSYAVNPDAGANGVVQNNTLVTISKNVTYTVYSMMYGDNTGMDIDYIANKVYGNAYYVNVFDLGGEDENLINNTIIADGNYTVAIISSSKNNTISGNIIRSLGSSVGDMKVPYVYEYVTEAIKLQGAVAAISDNYIESAGDYAVDLSDSASTLENNYIAAKKSTGSSAVINAANASIVNTTPSLKSIISVYTYYTQYVDGVVYPVVLLDENGEPISNVTVFATINGVKYNETTDADGYAAFVPELDAGGYDVLVRFDGNEVYGPKEAKGMIVVDMSASEIIAPASQTVLITAVKSGSYVTLTLKDLKDNGLANQTVVITFNGKTSSYVTDELGVIKYKLSANKAGTYTLKMNFTGDKNYVGSDATTTVKINKEAPKLTAAKKTYKAKVKTKKYTVTLKDSKGKAIKKAKVTLKVKGKTYKATTNAKGQATFKIKNLKKKVPTPLLLNLLETTFTKAQAKMLKLQLKNRDF